MNEEHRRILSMLAEGKITAEEAERLLDALGKEMAPAAVPASSSSPKRKPRYMRIVVESGGEGEEKVNMRVPLGLVRAGMRLGSLMPGKVHGKLVTALGCKGIEMDLNDLTSLSENLDDLCIDVEDKGDRVKIFCE